MNKFRRVELAESSSTVDLGSYRTRLGMWLSLNPPRSFNCPLCQRSFPSLQALGGHQNAHRKERNEMCRQYMDELEKRWQSPLSPLSLKTIPSHSHAVTDNYNLAQFQLLRQKPNERCLRPGHHHSPQVTVHPIMLHKNAIEARINDLRQNPYGASLENPCFLPSCRHPQLFDELPTRIMIDADADLHSNTPTDNLNSDAKSFADGTDETEVTSKPELDLNLRLSI